MSSRSNWVWWTSILGAASLVFGLAWLGIWSHVVQGGEPVGSMAYELRSPLGARLMVLAGLVLLIGAMVVRLSGKLRRKPE